MASKKFIELREIADEDLANELKETIGQYQQMKFDHNLRGLGNPLALRSVRRDIARIKTELSRRTLASDPSAVDNRTKIRARRRKK